MKIKREKKNEKLSSHQLTSGVANFVWENWRRANCLIQVSQGESESSWLINFLRCLFFLDVFDDSELEKSLEAFLYFGSWNLVLFLLMLSFPNCSNII